MKRAVLTILLGALACLALAAAPEFRRSIATVELKDRAAAGLRVEAAETALFRLSDRAGFLATAGFLRRGPEDWIPRLGLGGSLVLGGPWYADALYRLGYSPAGKAAEHRAELGLSGEWAGKLAWARGSWLFSEGISGIIATLGGTLSWERLEGRARASFSWSEPDGPGGSGLAEAALRTAGPLWLRAGILGELAQNELSPFAVAGVELRLDSGLQAGYRLEFSLGAASGETRHSFVLDVPAGGSR